MACTHLDTIALPRPSETDKAGAVCPACVESGSGWVHLRQCRSCGAIGCCDDSPNRHARAHWEAEGHPVIASMEPREAWSWCYADETMLTREERSVR